MKLQIDSSRNITFDVGDIAQWAGWRRARRDEKAIPETYTCILKMTRRENISLKPLRFLLFLPQLQSDVKSGSGEIRVEEYVRCLSMKCFRRSWFLKFHVRSMYTCPRWLSQITPPQASNLIQRILRVFEHRLYYARALARCPHVFGLSFAPIYHRIYIYIHTYNELIRVYFIKRFTFV